MSVAGPASLEGRRAIVTGAAAGLGKAFAIACADAGAIVSGLDKDPRIEALGNELGDRAGLSEVADLADAQAVRSFVDAAAERMGGLDILVNNAGVVVKTAPLSDPWEKAVEDFDAVVDVNFRGSYLVGRAAIPHLVRAGGGDIVNITTDHIHTCGYPVAVDHADAPDCRWADTRRPPLGNAAYDLYDSSKWALKGLTNVWARGLAEHGVRVNSFGMGMTDTPMIRAHLEAKGVAPRPGMLATGTVAALLVELLAEGVDGRTGDSVQIWPDHPAELPPVSLDGDLAMRSLESSR
jgi:NAD(P)-dependent dehydrogenase (short-subunit alcohol dehydrogenase family)